jgi:hypothetical protein
MSIINGRLPIKITAAEFVLADTVAVMGVILTAPVAQAAEAVIQDAHNNDLGTFNTTTSSGVSGVMFPNPITMSGLSVPFLTAGAILYIYLADV